MLSQTQLKTPGLNPLRIPFSQPFQPDPSCVLWLLAQQDGKWYDYSGKGNHGTITGASWKPTPAGPGLYFDGIDDYVNCRNDASLDIADAITIMVWVKFHNPDSGAADRFFDITSSTQDWKAVFYNDDAWDNKRLYFTTYNESGTREIISSSSDYLERNVWYYIVGTRDTSKIKLYVNGAVIDDGGASGSLAPIGTATYIGNVINATITRAYIDSRAWTAAEIARVFEVERCWFGV